MFKIKKLTMYNPIGEQYTYVFSEGINYFQGKNDTGKTEFYKFIDYMLGSSEQINHQPWFLDSLEKATIEISYNGLEYIFTRSVDPNINYFHYRDEEESNTPIDASEYKDKLNTIFTPNEELLKDIRTFTGENLTYRSFTMFSFLGETGQGLLYDFFDKCSQIEYAVKLSPILDFIFNRNLEEIFYLRKELEELQKDIEQLQNKAERFEFVFHHVNLHLNKLSIKTIYNGHNSNKIKEQLRLIKELQETNPDKNSKPVSELLALYNNINEQIKVYENAILDGKRIEKENQNRQELLATLLNLSETVPEMLYLTQPITTLLEELDKSIAFSQYLNSDATIKELRKQKSIIKQEIENADNRFQHFSLDQKARSIAIVEEYLSIDIKYDEEELLKKKKKARDIRNQINQLQKVDDRSKIDQLSSVITKLYQSASITSEVVKKDISQNGFHIQYEKRGNLLKPLVQSNDGDINYYTGSMARHTLIQLCGYLGFLDMLIRENRYPIIPVLVIDHISKPFDHTNCETIGVVLDSAYKLIGKENLQTFIFDDEESSDIGVHPDHEENLVTDSKTGFSPFYQKSS